MEHLRRWVKANEPDVLALQETRVTNQDFPLDEINAIGYRAAYSGQKTYNGVALLCRSEPRDVASEVPGLDDDQRRIVEATVRGVRVIDIYVPNGKTVAAPECEYKLDWLRGVTRHVKEQLEHHPRLLVVGDLNIAPEPRDVYDPTLWEGRVLFSEPERNAFRGLLATGLTDVFRRFEQPEEQFSWWDYRLQGFRRNHGLRIDHVLASNSMSKHCVRCAVDKAPRGWERPSDHAPVVAEFDI